MYSTRFRIVLLIVSVLCSAGLWVFGVSQKAAKPRGSYAVIICGEDIPDSVLLERLERMGISGIASESGQRVFLDSFGYLERVPLKEYNGRVLPFDPRNDGYAEKLRSMFVRDGKRFVYFPAGSPGIHKRLESAFSDIPHSVAYSGGMQAGLSPVFLFLSFCACACAFFIFRPLRRIFQTRAAGLTPCLPALSPFALGGVAGFSMAALLAGFAVFAVFPSGAKGGKHLLPPFFLAGFGLIVFLAGLPALFALFAAALFFATLIMSLRFSGKTAASVFRSNLLSADSGQKHRRFIPVAILHPKTDVSNFVFAMLPFTVIALALAVLSVAAPRLPEAVLLPLFPAGVVTEADFIDHYNFQSAFSYRSLHSPDAQIPAAMPVYNFDINGLPVGIPGGNESGGGLVDADIVKEEFLPFLPGSPVWEQSAPRSKGIIFSALLPAALPLFFIIPALAGRKRKRN